MIGPIVSLLIIGLIAGALARLLVPGNQKMSIRMTIALGVAGSFVGGFLDYVIFHKDAGEGALQPSSITGSVIGAVIVLLIWMKVGRRRKPLHQRANAYDVREPTCRDRANGASPPIRARPTQAAHLTVTE